MAMYYSLCNVFCIKMTWSIFPHHCTCMTYWSLFMELGEFLLVPGFQETTFRNY